MTQYCNDANSSGCARVRGARRCCDPTNHPVGQCILFLLRLKENDEERKFVLFIKGCAVKIGQLCPGKFSIKEFLWTILFVSFQSM